MFKKRFNLLSMSLVITLAVFVSSMLYPCKANAEISLANAKYINDEANLIDDDVEKELNSRIQQFYDETSTDLLIFTVDSVKDFQISRLDVGNEANTVLLVVSADEYPRFEVGEDLIEILPESRRQEILQNEFYYASKNEDYSETIVNTADAVMNDITVQVQKNESDRQKMSIAAIVCSLAAIILLAIRSIHSKQ